MNAAAQQSNVVSFEAARAAEQARLRPTEAERDIIAAILVNPDWLDLVSFLKADDFTSPYHQAIWQVVTEAHAIGHHYARSSLASELAEIPTFEGVTDIREWLEETINTNGYLAKRLVPDQARNIQRNAARRKLAWIGEAITNDANSMPPNESVQSAIARGIDALTKIEVHSEKPTTVWAGDKAREVLARDATQLDAAVVSTGLTDLDDKLSGGLRPGKVYVIAGRPGMGKSTEAASMALSVSTAGHGVLLISTEMGADEMAMRVVSDRVRRHYNWTLPYTVMIKKGAGLDMRDGRPAASAADDLAAFPLIIDESGQKTVVDIAGEIRNARAAFAKRGFELRLVIVDHIQHISASGAYKGNKVAETTEVSNDLLRLCKAEQLPFVVCSQLNRGVEGHGRTDKRPTMADIRESGSIEQDAHGVILLYRAEYYREKGEPDRDLEAAKWAEWETKRKEVENQLELIVDKNRSGPVGTVRVRCFVNTSTVMDL